MNDGLEREAREGESRSHSDLRRNHTRTLASSKTKVVMRCFGVSKPHKHRQALTPSMLMSPLWRPEGGYTFWDPEKNGSRRNGMNY